MLTLVIGNNKTMSAFNDRQAGFSLIEILVALFIMGLMTSAVIFNLPKQEHEMSLQAKKFAMHLHLASQTSLMEQISTGMRIEQDGYSLVKYDGAEWVPFLTHEFEKNERPQIILEKNGAVLDLEKVAKSAFPTIQYDMTGLATPFSLTLQSGGQKITLIGAADTRVTLNMNGYSK